MPDAVATVSGPPDPAQLHAIERTGFAAIGWTLAAALAAGYIAYFASLSSYPLQDFPNHLARGAIIGDLLFNHGVQYGNVYSLDMLPIPYLLHDLLLATFVKLFGAQAGAAAFLLMALLSMPTALLFYLWAARLAPRVKPVVFILGLYLATDTFFLLAFLGFRFALALILVCMGIVELLRRKWSGAVFVAYVVSLFGSYLTHLTATVFFAAILAISTLLRLALGTSTLRREAWLWSPLIVVLLLHAAEPRLLHIPAQAPVMDYFWGTWPQKLRRLTFEFQRFGSNLDLLMMLLMVACVGWPLRRHLRFNRLRQPTVLEPLFIAAAFVFFYLLLPDSTADTAFVDVRALPVALLMLVLACLNIPEHGESGRTFATWITLGLTSLLAVTNLAYLKRHIDKYEGPLNQYRALGQKLPRGSYVLPVHTLGKDGQLRPMLHAASYLVMDRQAVIPYLFSGDRDDPMKYFTYRQRPYWPEETWYQDRLAWDQAVEQQYTVGGQRFRWRFQYSPAERSWAMAELVPVDWNRVACRYQYLLITLPVDHRLIEVPTRPVAENGAAALEAVNKTACHPTLLVDKPVRLISEH